jgi:hypothetical protein
MFEGMICCYPREDVGMRALEGGGGYNWRTLAREGLNCRNLFLQVGGVGHKADDLARERGNAVAKSKEGKPGCNLTESAEEGCFASSEDDLKTVMMTVEFRKENLSALITETN